MIQATVAGVILAILIGCIFAADDFLYGTFPDDFTWGTATSSYQIEGGWNASGIFIVKI